MRCGEGKVVFWTSGYDGSEGVRSKGIGLISHGEKQGQRCTRNIRIREVKELVSLWVHKVIRVGKSWVGENLLFKIIGIMTAKGYKVI